VYPTQTTTEVKSLILCPSCLEEDEEEEDLGAPIWRGKATV